jgi:hypothetical protein
MDQLHYQIYILINKNEKTETVFQGFLARCPEGKDRWKEMMVCKTASIIFKIPGGQAKKFYPTGEGKALWEKVMCEIMMCEMALIVI